MYASYLLALRGAVGVSQGYLQTGAIASIREGKNAAARAFDVYIPALKRAAQIAASEAWYLGCSHAGAVENFEAPDFSGVASLVENMANRDALKASQLVQAQALQYDIYRRRGVQHIEALLKVSGESSNQVFAQLDKLSRRFESGSFVERAVREQAASMYVHGFLATASAKGIEFCRVVSPGEPTLTANLNTDMPLILKMFHPNAQSELRPGA